MTVGTGISGELNSVSCGRVFFPSGYKCCTDVCTAKENAVLAFGSGVGEDKSGRLNNVTCDSWGPSKVCVRSNCLRTRQHDKRVYILHKSQLVDRLPCEVSLGLQMGYGISVTLYFCVKYVARGSMLVSTFRANDTVHGQVSCRRPYIKAVSYLTWFSGGSLTNRILIPWRERASILSLKPVNTHSGGSNGAIAGSKKQGHMTVTRSVTYIKAVLFFGTMLTRESNNKTKVKPLTTTKIGMRNWRDT